MKASVFVGSSVDGFIARPNDALDFLDAASGGASEPSEESGHGYEEFIATIDAIVMGRNTYEVVLGFNAWPYGDKPVFVLSSGKLKPAPKGAKVEHMSGEPAQVVKQLESRGIKHIYVDGGVTIQRFLRAGLIQRVIVARVPVLIGEGIPLFGSLERDVVLKHVWTKTFGTGLVQTEYAVVAPARAAKSTPRKKRAR